MHGYLDCEITWSSARLRNWALGLADGLAWLGWRDGTGANVNFDMYGQIHPCTRGCVKVYIYTPESFSILDPRALGMSHPKSGTTHLTILFWLAKFPPYGESKGTPLSAP
jgi:hypothetical protein